MRGAKIIPNGLYKRIVASVPIACVDIVVKRKSGSVLLGVRKNWPMKGYVWVPGGRVYLNETLEHAALRKVLEETGLRVRIIKKVGAYTLLHRKGVRKHVVAVVFLAKETGGKLSAKRSDFSRFVEIRKPGGKLHPYVRHIILKSGAVGLEIADEGKTVFTD